MNITVYLGANEGNDPLLRKAVEELGAWIGSSGNALVCGIQALVGLPSMRTWQVPHAPSLQPSFTLVKCSSSRRKRMSF